MCLDCPDWDECLGCTIEKGGITPTCAAPLEHTSASEPGVTLQTLNVSRGYWRATNTSEKILACYNEDACSGGVTGADGFCASGYTGPCEEGCGAVTRLPVLSVDRYANPSLASVKPHHMFPSWTIFALFSLPGVHVRVVSLNRLHRV